MGLPYVYCKQCSAIRTISLTPSVIDHNLVLNYGILDMLKGATAEFSNEDADESSLRKYLGGSGFLGDYPAASQVIK